MDPLSNPVVILFAAVLPLLISFLKQTGFTSSQNAMIAFACYVAVGVVGSIAASGVPTWESIVEWIASVTVIGRVAYGMVWSKLGGSGEESLDARLTAATSIFRG